MACVDILSQLPPVVEDPFASWIKFDDDVSFNQFRPVPKDPLDIFSFLEQLDDSKNEQKNVNKKHIEEKKNENIPTLLDFNKNTANISSVFAKTDKNKPKVCHLYHQKGNVANNLSLNIVGLNTRNYFSNSQPTLQIKNEAYTFDKTATNLTPHNKVRDLRSFIRRKYKINNNIGILIIYSHSVLLNEHNTLKSYGICNNSCIFIAICEDLFKFNSFLLSDDNSADDFSKLFNILSNEYLQFENTQSQILNAIHRYQINGFKCKQITDLDILTYETDANCIEMPCGHGMTVSGLYGYVESELNSNKTFIKCPHMKHDSNNNEKCNKIWYFPIIRYILMQSKQYLLHDLMRLELLSSMNTFETYYHSSKCPDCKHNLYRHLCDDKNKAISHCPLCVNTFCWKCSGIWLDKSSQIFCGNEKCDNFECQVFKILSDCPLKRIGSVSDVPSIRLCPKCSQLIYHTEGCKHMNCHRCKVNFCFVCLKAMINDEWQCGSSSTICPSAPKQTNNDMFIKEIDVLIVDEIINYEPNHEPNEDWGEFL